MTPISLVIITYNEERNIARCIESVGELSDEVVVVDSFSTDRTEEICRQYGAKFIQHTFEGHIEQKNYAITQATHPHILSLDADEALSEELKQSIYQVKQNWRYDGYYFNRLTSYCGKWIRHSGWYPDRKLRLFDSRKGRWAGVNPHDRYEPDKGSTIRFLEGDLLQEFLDVDLEFHQLIVEASGNRYLSKIVEDTRLLVRVFTSTFWRYDRQKLAEANRFHQRLLDALRAQDTEAARIATVEAMRVAKRNALQAWDQQARFASESVNGSGQGTTGSTLIEG